MIYDAALLRQAETLELHTGLLALDSPVAVVLLTAPSLRSDSVVPTFEKLSKGAAPARPKLWARRRTYDGTVELFPHCSGPRRRGFGAHRLFPSEFNR